jgi:hypothetical protein
MSYISAQQSVEIGKPFEAVLSDNDDPHQQRGVPVRARLVSERVLCVDDEPRAIISRMTQDNVNTFLVDGGKGLRNRERRAALAHALKLLQQTAAALRPLAATSKEPEFVTEGLGLLYN